MKSLSSLWRIAVVAFGLCSANASQDAILVFNELMYHPSDDDAGGEWIELRNLNGVDVDISHWALEGAVNYDFPVGTVVLGNSFIVVAADPGKVPDALGPFTGRLDDDGEELRLVNNSNRVMCILDYNDAGKWPVAPDGSGVTLAKREVDSLATNGENWTWSAEMGGTPGAENFPSGVPARPLQFNEVPAADPEVFWLELASLASEATNLEGYRIRSSAGGDDYSFGGLMLEPGQLTSVDRAALGFEAISQGDRFYLMSADGGAVLDAVRLRGRARARFPDGSGPWLVPSVTTINEANVVTLQEDIVMTEIMYHYRPTYENETEGQAYADNSEEWIELFNRGTAAVDLTGWSFGDGIRFDFPDGTMLAPGAYLVVSNDAATLSAKHPGVAVLGDFKGVLGNRSDEILLEDAAGNPADVVAYFDGGAWPEDADGRGSSLELIDVRADNSLPGSWAASDESTKSEWKEYRYSGTPTRPPGTNFPRQWDEFILGLLDDGECLLDDVSVIEDPNGAKKQFLRNGKFAGSLFASDPERNWRFLGTHGSHDRTRVIDDAADENNTVLHLVATGATEHMHNHVETTLVSGAEVSTSTEYEISFRAKWIKGSPQLNTRLYFNYLPRTTILAMPDKHGTPGAANSIQQENAGPAYQNLKHFPAVGLDGEPITITVHASDPDGIESMSLKWRDDDGDFESVPMSLTADGLYQGQIPGQPAKSLFGSFNETKIQFYVEGKDTTGATTWMPAAGPESRAMVPLEDDKPSEGPGHNLRIVMPEADADWLHTTTNVMSNHRMKCTVIYKEQEAFYDVGVRLKGSQRGRDKTVRAGFSLAFPSDNRFRGLHGIIAVDRSGAGDQFSQKEILVKHAINRFGDIPGMYDDLIHVIAPRDAHTGSAMLLMARYDAEYLDAQYENGSDGRMYEYELIYFPTSTVGGDEGLKRPNPDSVTGVNHRDLGDDKETYRWHYLNEGNRAADDYSSLIPMLKTFGMPRGDEYYQRLNEQLDVDQWLRSYAAQSLYGIGDNYSTGSQHNMVIYIRPSDDKALYFPWDMDFTFSRGARDSIDPNTDMRKMIGDPLHERSFYQQMFEMVETTFNKAYMERWADHYASFLPRESFGSFVNYIDTRSNFVETEIRKDFPKVPFKITNGGNGENFSTDMATITLEGEGWIDVAAIRVGDTEYEPTWVGRTNWELTIPLALGENVIELQGLDLNGGVGSIFSPIGDDKITITNTGALEAASADNLVVSEIMYHPADASEAEIAAGFTNRDDFEFIELQNIGANTIDLSGVRFTKGIDFDFTETTLEAGAFAVLVSDPAAFEQRYGDVVIVSGTYQNRLRNSGESLRLRAVDETIIKEFSYEDSDPWPKEADGDGFSLILADTAANGDPSVPTNWRTSSKAGGTPGTAESPAAPIESLTDWLATRGGDANADPNNDGIPLLLDYALGTDLSSKAATTLLPTVDSATALTYRKRDGTTLTYQLQSSNDLQDWEDITPETQTSTSNGDGTTNLTVVISTAPAQYLRLQVTP